jgi:polyisoprenoid-binding protein YceI
MTRRPALLALAVLLLLVVGGGATAWALFLRGDEIAPLSLPSSGAGASSAAAAGAGAGSAAASGVTTSLPPASAAAIDAASIPGTWTIASNSVVGYRVREKLASLPAESDAVGRTSSITGSATVASAGGTLSVPAATFTVDMTTLASDRRMRDNRLRSDGIQTDSFPSSSFTLTKAVAVPGTVATGGQVSITLHGDLTLHGVTKTVDIPATAQLNGSLIQVLGSLDFPFSDFGINAPNIGGFVSVQDHGTLEFLVNLAHA